MDEGANLIQHVNQFNQIIRDLGRVGVTVEDEDLLCSLTPAYETLVTALLADKETISLQSATDSLFGHHNRRQQQGGDSNDNSQGDGLYVNISQGNAGKNNKRKQGDGRMKKALL